MKVRAVQDRKLSEIAIQNVRSRQNNCQRDTPAQHSEKRAKVQERSLDVCARRPDEATHFDFFLLRENLQANCVEGHGDKSNTDND